MTLRIGTEHGQRDMTPEEMAAHIAQADAPASVPATVTPLQMRRALRAAGLYDSIAAAIPNLPVEMQEAWEYAVTFPRDDALIAAAAQQFNLTSAQVDDLFRVAAQL